jgi:hypothetical protein
VHEQFRAPRAHQAADAEHLAGPQFKLDVMQLRRAAFSIGHGERIDLEDSVARL